MFRPTLLRCFLVAGVLGFATSSMWAQTSAKTATTQKAAEKTEKKFRGRLPNNYGKIALDQKQKTAIYAVQEKYHAEMEELEQRLADLKVKQGEEILAVLTDEQKTALKALLEKPKAGAKSTTTTKKTTTDK